MSLSRFRRLTTVASAATLALMLLGVGAAQASPPQWVQSPITKLPPTVAVGTYAGYSFSVTNTGPSNISSLYLLSTVTQPAAYAHWKVNVGDNPPIREGSCPTDAQLKCTVGALNASQTASFVIAYAVGTSNFTATFQANTTGSIITPNGHNHGDLLQWIATTSVSNSQNFGGGFVIDSTTAQDNQTIGRNNPQATKVTSPEALVPVTVQDGTDTALTCQNPNAVSLFGECSVVNVNNNHDYTGTPFKITILVYGGSVPGGTATTDIFVLHTTDTTTYPIDQACTFTGTATVPNNVECLTVTKVGSNFKIEVWVNENGGYRGGYG